MHGMTKSKLKPPIFRFLNHYTFVWDGGSWVIAELGPVWFTVHLSNHVYRTNARLWAEFDVKPPTWVTIRHHESMIFKCKKHPVFSVDPDPIFLRGWLDTWIETEGYRIFNYVLDQRRVAGDDYRKAETRAKAEMEQFLFLFLPPGVKP